MRRIAGTAAVLGAVLWATVALAGSIHSTKFGALDTCASGCTTGASSQLVLVDGALATVFQATSTGTIDLKVENSIDGITWSDVTSASCTSCSSPQKWSVLDPVGYYRFNVGTCTSCTFATSYRATDLR